MCKLSQSPTPPPLSTQERLKRTDVDGLRRSLRIKEIHSGKRNSLWGLGPDFLQGNRMISFQNLSFPISDSYSDTRRAARHNPACCSASPQPFFQNLIDRVHGVQEAVLHVPVCAQQGLSMPRERAQAEPLAAGASASSSRADTRAVASSAARGTWASAA